MSFIDLSYLELWQLICLADRNLLCNFVKGHHKQHFFEIILNLDQQFRCRLKDLIWSSGAPFVRWSGTVCAILKEDMGNISVNLF